MGTPAELALAGAGGGAPPGGGGGAPPNGGAPPGGGGGAQTFYSGWAAPEQKEVRDWVAAKAYADPFVLAKSARDWERDAITLRANKGYPVPGQDGKVDEQALRGWRTATGVPESADKYEIPVPDGNPYPQFKAYMSEELLKAHVPAAMAPILAKGYETAVQRMEADLRAQEDTASQQGLKTIEQQWGAQYAERMSVANRAKAWMAKEAGGLNDIQLRTLESVLGTPAWLTMLYKFGEANREAIFAGDGGSPPGFQGGASEAQARIDQLTADRTAQKISDHQWREITKTGGEYDQLMAQIAKGFAPQQ